MTTLMSRLNSRRSRLVASSLVLALAGGLSLGALAGPRGGAGCDMGDGPMMGGMMGGMMMGAGPMGGGMGGGKGGGMMMGGPRMDRMFDAINATPEQRTQLKQIMDSARTDMKAMHDSHTGMRDQMRQAFTQPTVDARTVEALRQQMLAHHDQASKRMSQAMLDASAVLTPAQRQQMAERMAQRQGMMHRHHGGNNPAAGATVK